MAFNYNDYTESESVKKKREEAEKYKTYNASQSVTDAKTALDTHEQNRVADWTGGTYGESLKAAMDRINNREKFTYDLNGDALYQQYKDQHINQGRMAMQDTMGQAAAMTGGYGNSYAATAGNQAYQSYLQQLNDVIPELYNLALNKYNLEGQELKDQYNMLNQQYNNEYGQYRDQVSDWNTEAARLSDRYYNESNLDYSRYADNRDYYTNEYNNERNYDYGLYSDNYNRAFTNYQQDVSEKQSAEQLALQRSQLEQSAAQHQAEMNYKYAALNASKNTTTEKTKFSLDNFDKETLESYLNDGDLSKYESYVSWLESQGLPESEANALYARLPEDYWEDEGEKTSGIKKWFTNLLN